MKPGIYKDVSWQDYIAIDAMNPSKLKHGRRSMRRLKRAIDGECEPKKETTAIGNAVHCMLAGEVDDRYAIVPDFENDAENILKNGDRPKSPKATKYYKDKLAAWESDNTKEVLTEVQYATAKKVLRNVIDSFGRHLNETNHEVVVVGEINGVLCKTRLDGLHGNLVWDLKVARDASDHAFYRTYKQLGYGLAAAMHLELLRQNGVRVQEYRYLLAEPCDDYDTRDIDVPIIAIENQLDQLHNLITDYDNSRKQGIWPGMGPGVLAIPDWDMAEPDWSEPDDKS